MWWFLLTIALTASVPNASPPPTVNVVLWADTWAQCRGMQQSATVQPPAVIVSVGTCSPGAARYQ